MKLLQKIIASILLIGLILGPSLGLLFFEPRKAKGAVGVPVQDVPTEIQEIKQTIKEWGLDKIVRTIARMAMNRLRASIIRWAQGGFRDDNQPLAITNWKNFFRDAINIGSARFIQEFNLTALCPPFNVAIGEILGLARPYYTMPTYQEYAACTIGTIVDNVEDFFENPSITIYGWDTWTALSQPQNNIYGSILMAAERRAELESEEKEAAQAEGQAGQGYQDETICTEDDETACKLRCAEVGPPSPQCLTACERSSLGVCLNERIKNLGSTTHAAIEKVVGSDIDWLISADEFSELIEVLFSSLLNKMMFGLGLNKPSSYISTTQQKYREQYSYHQITKQMLTPQQQYQVKSKTLSRVLSIIQSINRSIKSCEKETAVEISEIIKAYNEILEGESQALYTETERIDLQPDYEVLDPINAPANLVVYGYSWQNIPAVKYPQKCQEILRESGLSFGSTCSNIRSGLPPVSQNSQCECISNHNHHNCPPAPYPPIPANQIRNVWTLALDQAKANFYNSCKSTYDNVVNLCNECLKRAETQCEVITNATERTNCINRVCDNYSNTAGVIGPQDFYNKCLIEERKSACYTCLKEYFMPADYCGQTGDYIARATVKYPGTYHKSKSFLGIDWLAADKVAWIGVREPNQCPDSETDRNTTSVDLICRIIPDVTLGGVRICQTNCPLTASFTQEMLYDINDNRPHGGDCNYQEIRTGGMPGIWAVEYGTFEMKSKCCRAFKGHKPDDYAACGGQATQIVQQCTGLPATWEPWCHCPESWRPILGGRVRTGGLWIGTTSPGGDCDSGVVSTLDDNRMLLVYTGGGPNSETYFIGTDTCSETDPTINNTDKEDTNPDDGYVDGDGVPDGDPTDASPPNNMLWSAVPGGDPAAQGRQNSESWCIDPNIIGLQRGVDYTVGVFHNGWEDTGSSSVMVCSPCFSSDSDYPYYGIRDGQNNLNDQCRGKIPETLWIDNCGL